MNNLSYGNGIRTGRLGFLLATALFFFSTSSAAECPAGRVRVQVLGSGGPEFFDRRASSSYLIWLDRKAVVMIDAGSGSGLNFEKSGADIADLEAVLFTHFHVDHSVEFPTLVKASYFSGRDTNLMVYGPAGNELMPSAKEFINALLGKKGVYRYLSEYVSPSATSRYKIVAVDIPLNRLNPVKIALSETISVSAIAVHHGPIPALAWRVEAAGCSFAFSGDMSNRYHTLDKLSAGADILIAHHAVAENASGAARNLHMPPSEIGKIAALAKVKKLVLSHRMQRTLGMENETASIIRKEYDGPLFFANDLDGFEPGEHR
ncbi:MAG: MBL fold metallo-hydrolase [Gammaproteobacteria bacterium]